MKKNYLTIVACVAMAFSANAVEEGEANIYASGLKVNGNNLEFVLNATPTEVQVVFKDKNDAVVKTLDVADAKKGQNTISLEGVFNNVKANTKLTWEVVAKAEANTEVVKFSDATVASQQIYSASGIAVETNPKLDTFGRVYVVNSQPSSTQTEGVFILDATLNDVTGQGKTAYSGKISWTEPGLSARSPFRAKLDNEGNLFIADYGDDAALTNTGIYVMNTLDPSADFVSVFSGTRNESGLVYNNSEELIHGRIWDFALNGEGSERTMLTIDNSIIALNGGMSSNKPVVSQYKIGKLDNSWTNSYDIFYTNPGAEGFRLDVNETLNIASDNNGGAWVSQTNSATKWPSIMHINSNGVCDYGLEDKAKYYQALVSSPDNTILAYTSSSNGTIWYQEIKWTDGVPSLSNEKGIEVGIGNATRAIAIDVANNIYVCATSAENIEAFALPKAENTYTTPANEIIIVNETMTGIADVVDANPPVEYFNLQGVKVENPVNGIFVKKQAGKAIKIIL